MLVKGREDFTGILGRILGRSGLFGSTLRFISPLPFFFSYLIHLIYKIRIFYI